jgi:hypothetical protein
MSARGREGHLPFSIYVHSAPCGTKRSNSPQTNESGRTPVTVMVLVEQPSPVNCPDPDFENGSCVHVGALLG